MDVEWIRSHWEREHQNALALAGLSGPQKTALGRLDQMWAVKGQSLPTRTLKLRKMRQWGLFLGKPFEEATRAEIQSYLARIEASSQRTTFEGAKRVLKSTYKDMLNPDEPGHPEIVRWIRLDTLFRETKTSDDLLTLDDVRRLLEAATDPRDRALVMVLDESAARLTEVAALRISDVQFDEYGALVTVGGDTDRRRVRLMHSVPDLTAWLNVHPRRRDPRGPLWTSRSSFNRNEALGAGGIYLLLQRLAKAAGVRKKVHPHLFRHGRTNQWLDKYNDDVVKYFAGWSKSSKMVEVYRHRSGKRFDQIILEKEGVLKGESSTRDPGLRSRPCVRCQEKNSPAAEYCAKCSLPLDEKRLQRAAQEYDLLQRNEGRLRWLLQRLEDPRVRALLGSNPVEPNLGSPA